MDKCPTCRTPVMPVSGQQRWWPHNGEYGEAGVWRRNRSLEDVIANMTIRCPNPNCPHVTFGRNMKEHWKKCDKKEVKCPAWACDRDIPIGELAKHFEESHRLFTGKPYRAPAGEREGRETPITIIQ